LSRLLQRVIAIADRRRRCSCSRRRRSDFELGLLGTQRHAFVTRCPRFVLRRGELSTHCFEILRGSGLGGDEARVLALGCRFGFGKIGSFALESTPRFGAFGFLGLEPGDIALERGFMLRVRRAPKRGSQS
jgi:hypothetical protein